MSTRQQSIFIILILMSEKYFIGWKLDPTSLSMNGKPRR